MYIYTFVIWFYDDYHATEVSYSFALTSLGGLFICYFSHINLVYKLLPMFIYWIHELYIGHYFIVMSYNVNLSGTTFLLTLEVHFLSLLQVSITFIKLWFKLPLLQECFDPIVDAVSGRDLIPAMVYGLETVLKYLFRLIFLLHFFFSINVSLTYRRSVRGQEFGGMYCALLTVK